MPTRVFVAQPHHSAIEPEAYEAVNRGSADQEMEIAALRRRSSLLANSFNRALCTCLGAREVADYFCLLHADVVPCDGFLDIGIESIERYGFAAVHASCAIKDGNGDTSTAIAFSDDLWAPIRRITTTELHQLPDTFSLFDIRRELDPTAFALLPNTGCLLIKIEPWLWEFPGFAILDRIVTGPTGKRQAEVLSEDWHFGFWARANGIRIGGSRKITTRHIGPAPFTTEHPWGRKRDEEYFELIRQSRGGWSETGGQTTPDRAWTVDRHPGQRGAADVGQAEQPTNMETSTH